MATLRRTLRIECDAIALLLRDATPRVRLKEAQVERTDTGGFSAIIADLGQRRPKISVWLDHATDSKVSRVWIGFESASKGYIEELVAAARSTNWEPDEEPLRASDWRKESFYMYSQPRKGLHGRPFWETYPSIRRHFFGYYDWSSDARNVDRHKAKAFLLGVMAAADPDDEEEAAFEGEARLAFRQHRKRECSLRHEKIRRLLRQTKRLVCEVPRCGFDFVERYGKIGEGFAEVHHLYPLGDRKKTGAPTRLKDLAVVCANCHRMIHRGGQSRSLGDLIPATRRT